MVQWKPRGAARPGPGDSAVCSSNSKKEPPARRYDFKEIVLDKQWEPSVGDGQVIHTTTSLQAPAVSGSTILRRVRRKGGWRSTGFGVLWKRTSGDPVPAVSALATAWWVPCAVTVALQQKPAERMGQAGQRQKLLSAPATKMATWWWNR